MGLESYLFYVKFKTPPTEQTVVVLLQQAGMKYLEEKSRGNNVTRFRDRFFELRSEKGLTEANILLAPGKTAVDYFSLRFSILSPAAVIDQTFNFLQNLNKQAAIEVHDTEISNHLFRQLRQAGEVDQNFKGLADDEVKKINKRCIIPLDPEDFRRNEPGIMKRHTVLTNTEGETIEGGSATISFIEKKGLFDRFLGWIKKEL